MNRDCWTEMDLYWFQGKPVQEKTEELFGRLTPLWQRSPGARKGLSLCIGWLYDSVLYWNGNPDEVITTCQAPTYEPWTYRRLGQLVAAIKDEAIRRNIEDFHVAIILLGGSTMAYNADATCEGWSGRTEGTKEKAHYNVEGRWFYEHPEIDGSTYGVFYFGSKVNVPEEEAVCKLATPTFGEYFADKLCGMSQYVGFDAVVLRDSVFSPAYVRGNRKRYMDPGARAALSDTFIQLLKRIKDNIPGYITIGYSSGTSSMEELRSHGFDLEAVAMSGYLDLWITQTWASAWQDYWPIHSMGFTFQLCNLLTNLAMLANTPCGSMFLIETFDAWEPWDSIHQYPKKVAWEIWAYSHATLRLPGGARRPQGCYISWMNKGYQLIPEETVGYIRSVMDQSTEDLRDDPIPGGPCLIYHRDGLTRLLEEPADYSRGEEMDDWAAMLLKYGAPVLSITRSEWLRDVDADGFLFAAPAAIDADLSEALLAKLESKTPVLFTGQAKLLPEELRSALSITVEDAPTLCDLASAADVEETLARAIGTRGLVINQRQRSLWQSNAWSSLIAINGGPVLAKHRAKPCLIWETPEWGTPRELHLTCQSIGSPQTYLAVAQAFSQAGWGAQRVNWINDDWLKPVCLLFWRHADGSLAALLGNLETGVTGNSQFAVKGTLHLENHEAYACEGKEGFRPGWIRNKESGLHVALPPHGACAITAAKE